MENLWSLFCGNSECSNDSPEVCTRWFFSVTHPDSCVNHIVIILSDVILLALVLHSMICRTPSKKVNTSLSTLQISSAVFNGCLGLVYIGLGIRVFEENLRIDHSFLPIHLWVLLPFQGLTWLLVGLTAILRGNHVSETPFRLLSILSFLYSAILSIFAVASIINHEIVTAKVILDITTFLGANLLLWTMYKGCKNEERRQTDNGSTLYTALKDEDDSINKDGDVNVQHSPFAKAGFFSKMSFWWLNPLMKLGKQSTLSDEDIPKLHDSVKAESCYIQFMDQLIKQKDGETSLQSSLFWTIIACHRREILISGFFALISILTLSAGPLLLNSFIKVSEGKEAFKYEGYLLAISLFVIKILESLSRRQWYFHTRIIGVKVKSLLTALIYKKQLRLSSDARKIHSGGEIMSYVTVDAHRIGEFCFWFHQAWTTALQICIALAILIHLIGLATIASLLVLILTVLCNFPLAKLQHKFQTKLMVAQDERLKACSEALVNMKVLKFYAWETHFKNTIEGLRKVECKWLLKVHLGRVCYSFLYWTSPIPISGATFAACYFLGVPLNASNVFTFVATLCLVQDPLTCISNILSAVIQATVAFTRIAKFLGASELQAEDVRKKTNISSKNHAILMNSANLSWEMDQSKPTLTNISLEVLPGAKIAICGEVSSGKSTLLSTILGEVPYKEGTVEVCGGIAYVSQTAWIQSGTIRDNILFGSAMDELRYQETLQRCSLVKDLELLPYGDMTEIGERGVNMSGGQKQRVQLARALYRDADIYLLDDPFSAVDAHTATSLFREYVMEALSKKTVLLVTHQVDFLPAFQCCLLLSEGEILRAGHYTELLASSSEFADLVNAHKKTAGTRLAEVGTFGRENYVDKKTKTSIEIQYEASNGDRLIKQEERNEGDTGFKSYLIYLKTEKSYLYLLLAVITQLIFSIGQIAQNYWMASNVDNSDINPPKLIVIYLCIGICFALFAPFRSLALITLGMNSSKSLFSQQLKSLFRAPMSFYDSTPLGRILSRVTSDLNIVDLDIALNLLCVISPTITAYSNLGLLAVITPQVLFVYIPVIYMIIRIQRYYLATAKELMRIQGTTKSLVANHLAESVAGVMTIRAFEEQDRFFAKNFNLVDRNASPFLLNFAASEWLIQRVETLNAVVLSSVALCMVLLPPTTISSGFVGMALAYGLSLNSTMVFAVQSQCILDNNIVSVERLNQYMHLPSEAAEVIEDRRPPQNWPAIGKVKICNLQIRYRKDAPLVLRGISCTFEGGDRIGIVGRTGSGKTTLIGALFRLVEPAQGKIIVDGIDISLIGLHDLRSRFGIIPQDPTLFNGTVRFNLDPLCQHTDDEIWEVLSKCQLKESVQEKTQGLDSTVLDEGSNWSMGQRQLFCLGRALLRRSRVLVLDEATASIDNATDMILQKTIRTEFADCTVITVAHRIPTVMDCTKVLAISDGKLMEYDEPMKLMKTEGSLFGQLVKEYWSHIHSAESH